MNKTRFAIVLMLALNTVHAEWINFGVTGTKGPTGAWMPETVMDFYYDPQSIVHYGQRTRIWWLIDYHLDQQTSSGVRYLSDITAVEFDCQHQLYRNVQSSKFRYYMGRGDMVDDDPNPNARWRPLPPSGDEYTKPVVRSLWEFACKPSK